MSWSIVNAKKTFQSTPSVGRATQVAINAILTAAFQSTPSVGRATFAESKDGKPTYISIHALRGEGDF